MQFGKTFESYRIYKRMLSDGRLTGGHARPLVAVADEKRQEELATIIVNNNLSVREVGKAGKCRG